jgi:hypothetical protein
MAKIVESLVVFGGGYRWRNVRRKQFSTLVKYPMKSFVKSTVVIHFLVTQNSTANSLVKATVVTHFPCHMSFSDVQKRSLEASLTIKFEFFKIL